MDDRTINKIGALCGILLALITIYNFYRRGWKL